MSPEEQQAYLAEVRARATQRQAQVQQAFPVDPSIDGLKSYAEDAPQQRLANPYDPELMPTADPLADLPADPVANPDAHR